MTGLLLPSLAPSPLSTSREILLQAVMAVSSVTSMAVEADGEGEPSTPGLSLRLARSLSVQRLEREGKGGEL